MVEPARRQDRDERLLALAARAIDRGPEGIDLAIDGLRPSRFHRASRDDTFGHGRHRLLAGHKKQCPKLVHICIEVAKFVALARRVSRRGRLAKLYGTRLEAGKVRGIMSEAAGGPELTVVDAIDTNLDLFLHRLRYRRHHMACDFTTIDHLGVGKPRGHVLPPFGRRKPTNMRGPDTRRTLLHARSSSKIVRPPMKARDALEGRIHQPGLIFLGLWLLSTATPDGARWPPRQGWLVPRATMSNMESRLVCRRAGPGLQWRKSTKVFN